jgi:hypothetical protein
MSNVDDRGGGGKLSPDSEEVRLVTDLAYRYYLLRCEGKVCPWYWTHGQGQLFRGDVRRWLCEMTPTELGPNNVGWFLGGAKSGDGQAYCAIDVDLRHGGADAFAALVRELGPLPDTVRDVREEGGPHYYCTMPVDLLVTGDHQRSRVVLGPGVEFMANNAQILIPPSIGSDGHRRRWVVRPRLPGEPWNFAPLPDAWAAFVQSRVRKPLPPPPASPPSKNARPPDVPAPAPVSRPTVRKGSLEWLHLSPEERAMIDPDVIRKRVLAFLEAVGPATPEVDRHRLKFRVACALVHGFELTVAEALEYLTWWGRGCDPVPSEADLRALLNRVPPQDGSGRPMGYLLRRDRPRDREGGPG